MRGGGPLSLLDPPAWSAPSVVCRLQEKSLEEPVGAVHPSRGGVLLAERIGEALPTGARLAAWPNVEHYQWLQHNGMLRDDIVVTEQMPPDYLLLVARRASFRPYHWRIYEYVRPELAVEVRGVELAGLYAWDASEEVEPDPEDP